MTDPESTFLESLMETELYSIGAYFCDEHPDLVDELVGRAGGDRARGLEAYSGDRGDARSRRRSRRS